MAGLIDIRGTIEPLQSVFAQLLPENSTITSLLIVMTLIIFFMRLMFIFLRKLFDPLVTDILEKRILQLKQGNMEKIMLLSGSLTASLLQSSSSTIYILISLVRRLECGSRALYPLILGINVGTCLTTILFSLLLQSKLALAIGIAHLLYNLLTLIVFTYIPLLKELPILASRHLAYCSND